MEYLRTKSGGYPKMLLKDQHTDHPSIQGAWTPFTHRDPSLNVEKFPNVSKK